ncbi:hypothetical protein C1X30_29930, partial [Pseudomonas sp. FW305-BF6]
FSYTILIVMNLMLPIYVFFIIACTPSNMVYCSNTHHTSSNRCKLDIDDIAYFATCFKTQVISFLP